LINLSAKQGCFVANFYPKNTEVVVASYWHVWYFVEHVTTAIPSTGLKKLLSHLSILVNFTIFTAKISALRVIIDCTSSVPGLTLRA